MVCARLAAARCRALRWPLPAGSRARRAARRGPARASRSAPDEPVVHTFSRTPSFAWQPVAGAKTLPVRALDEQERSPTAASSGRRRACTSPAVAVPISLPWMTGKPYSLYAHVRAYHARSGATSWSAPFGFNMRWSAVPAPITPAYPGLLRWSTVAGRERLHGLARRHRARSFSTARTWRTSASTTPSTRARPSSSTVHWRVRPVRWLYGADRRTASRPSRTGPGARSTRATTRRSRPGR